MAIVSKRIFDTDNALKGSFNGMFGKWQLIAYSMFAFAYAIIVGWIGRLLDYTLLAPKHVQCDYAAYLSKRNYTNTTVIQRLSGKSVHYIHELDAESGEMKTIPFKFNTSGEFGLTAISEYDIYCDLRSFVNVPRFAHIFGYLIGALVLSIASDRGGRKMIILACIWSTGIMSLFQLVGHDFVSFTFFQFFLGLFIGGVQATYLPAIIEMFPINFRTFYGCAFHMLVALFELMLPWLAKSLMSWKLLQMFITLPLILTASLYWFVFESIFWHLAHKEYDKAIKTLTHLAKRNGISFESKFKQAKEFLHAKHSKATQVDILPLLRLQDVELLGKKYPQVDMAELQKQKANSSKVRRFLNSLKGASYRSTNTIYRPLDFIYSPTLLVYVLIMSGLWLVNGLAESMESVKSLDIEHAGYEMDIYLTNMFSALPYLLASVLATLLALLKYIGLLSCFFSIIEIIL
jgi:MFS family permease